MKRGGKHCDSWWKKFLKTVHFVMKCGFKNRAFRDFARGGFAISMI